MMYAGFWRRLAAYIVDMVLFGIARSLLFVPFAIPPIPTGSKTLPPEVVWPIVVSTLVVIVLQWLYFALMESSKYQATLGKILLKIKVADLNGQKISFGRATGRHFAKIISGLILMIGYIMAAFTEKKQGLHDIMAGTLVLKDISNVVGDEAVPPVTPTPITPNPQV